MGGIEKGFFNRLADNDEKGWSTDLLRMHYAFWVDDNAISPSSTIKMSTNVIIYTTIRRRQASFLETFQSLLSSLQAYEEY